MPKAHFSSPGCLPRASFEDKLVFLGNMQDFSNVSLLSYIITLILKTGYIALLNASWKEFPSSGREEQGEQSASPAY